jgi:hemin uptake protein HemP
LHRPFCSWLALRGTFASAGCGGDAVLKVRFSFNKISATDEAASTPPKFFCEDPVAESFSMMANSEEPDRLPPPIPDKQEGSPANPPLLLFETLAQGSQEILIDYRSQIYRLRVTRNGKLILNK